MSAESSEENLSTLNNISHDSEFLNTQNHIIHAEKAIFREITAHCTKLKSDIADFEKISKKESEAVFWWDRLSIFCEKTYKETFKDPKIKQAKIDFLQSLIKTFQTIHINPLDHSVENTMRTRNNLDYFIYTYFQDNPSLYEEEILEGTTLGFARELFLNYADDSTAPYNSVTMEKLAYEEILSKIKSPFDI